MRHALTVSLAIIAVLAMAAIASAGSTANWNGTGCTLRLVENEAHVAEMDCQNRLNAANTFVSADLEAGGLVVELTIVHEPGDEPDWFHIGVPDGYWAEPSDFELAEDAGRVVLIYEWVGS